VISSSHCLLHHPQLLPHLLLLLQLGQVQRSTTTQLTLLLHVAAAAAAAVLVALGILAQLLVVAGMDSFLL
jgi:hypothetical protein